MTEDDSVGGREAPAQARQPTLGGTGVVSDRDNPPADLDLELSGE